MTDESKPKWGKPTNHGIFGLVGFQPLTTKMLTLNVNFSLSQIKTK